MPIRGGKPLKEMRNLRGLLCKVGSSSVTRSEKVLWIDESGGNGACRGGNVQPARKHGTESGVQIDFIHIYIVQEVGKRVDMLAASANHSFL